MAKTVRGGRVLVDWSQNNPAKTPSHRTPCAACSGRLSRRRSPGRRSHAAARSESWSSPRRTCWSGWRPRVISSHRCWAPVDACRRGGDGEGPRRRGGNRDAGAVYPIRRARSVGSGVLRAAPTPTFDAGGGTDGGQAGAWCAVGPGGSVGRRRRPLRQAARPGGARAGRPAEQRRPGRAGEGLAHDGRPGSGTGAGGAPSRARRRRAVSVGIRGPGSVRDAAGECCRSRLGCRRGGHGGHRDRSGHDRRRGCCRHRQRCRCRCRAGHRMGLTLDRRRIHDLGQRLVADSRR